MTRYPDAVNGDGSHMARYFLRKRNALYFAARDLRAKVSKMVARGPEDRKQLNELKRGVTRLEKQARGSTQRAKKGDNGCPKTRGPQGRSATAASSTRKKRPSQR